LEELAQIAAGWRVATRTGASMASTMDAVAERLRTDQQVSGVVRAELSAPRATGRLLAALPLAGLLLGYLMGGDPLGFLTGTPIGEGCLVLGVALMCAGLVWTDHLADRAGGTA
jgi:tight adherence protein B